MRPRAVSSRAEQFESGRPRDVPVVDWCVMESERRHRLHRAAQVHRHFRLPQRQPYQRTFQGICMHSFSAPCSPDRQPHRSPYSDCFNSCNDVTADGCEEDAQPNPVMVVRRRALREKHDEILKFLKEHRSRGLQQHAATLRTFAQSRGGLVDDDFRIEIWPYLAEDLAHRYKKSQRDGDDSASTCGSGLTSASSDSDLLSSDFESALSDLTLEQDERDEDRPYALNRLAALKQHKEWRQVELDVHRTLARFPPNITDTHREILQEDLTPMIVDILALNPRFNYYQGFHDILLTFLLVVGREKALQMGKVLASSSVFSEYLLKSLEHSVMSELNLMYVLLWRIDPKLEKFMRGVELGVFFALSWPLTWFSHSLQDYHQIVRCFDAFLAGHPLLPIYLSAAIVFHRRSAILSMGSDMPPIHALLTTMPNELPLEELLQNASYMMTLIPPAVLRGKYLEEYRSMISQASPARPRFSGQLSRYAIQLVVVGAASAVAGYYFMHQS